MGWVGGKGNVGWWAEPPFSKDVAPAKAGVHSSARASGELDPCLRRDDKLWGGENGPTRLSGNGVQLALWAGEIGLLVGA
jgi:hypothetical protein